MKNIHKNNEEDKRKQMGMRKETRKQKGHIKKAKETENT